jgi:hypothetical protein
VDIKKASKYLEKLLKIQAIEMPRNRIEIVKDEKDELRVQVDTLWVLLARMHVTKLHLFINSPPSERGYASGHLRHTKTQSCNLHK